MESYHIFWKNSRYLKIIADNSLIAYNKIISVADSVATNVTNTLLWVLGNTVQYDYNAMSDECCVNKFWKKKYIYNRKILNGLLHFAQVLISDDVTIYDRHYLLSSCKR